MRTIAVNLLNARLFCCDDCYEKRLIPELEKRVSPDVQDANYDTACGVITAEVDIVRENGKKAKGGVLTWNYPGCCGMQTCSYNAVNLEVLK